VASHAATDREPEEGPYFDEIDEKQSSIIEEAYLRRPLSEIFVRNCCEQKMRRDGSGNGGYRCSQIRQHRCWNKASSEQQMTHDTIGGAIIQTIRSLGKGLDRLLQRVSELLEDHGRRQARQSPPTRKELEDRIEQIIEQVRTMDRTCRQELELLVGQIQAVPYQQFGTNQVVLRVRFQLRLMALLPFQTRAALAARCDGPIEEQFESIPMLVDLFYRSAGPKHGLEALRLKEEEHLGPTAIGRRLGITKRQANIAVQYGKAMRAAGVTDLYVELTETPAAASRWRPPGYRKAQQNKESP